MRSETHSLMEIKSNFFLSQNKQMKMNPEVCPSHFLSVLLSVCSELQSDRRKVSQWASPQLCEYQHLSHVSHLNSAAALKDCFWQLWADLNFLLSFLCLIIWSIHLSGDGVEILCDEKRSHSVSHFFPFFFSDTHRWCQIICSQPIGPLLLRQLDRKHQGSTRRSESLCVLLLRTGTGYWWAPRRLWSVVFLFWMRRHIWHLLIKCIL